MLSGKREPMTDEMKRQIAYAKGVREKEKTEAHAKTADKARWIWEQAQ
jgi:uncharacterized protein YifE (UPF0438 family)